MSEIQANSLHHHDQGPRGSVAEDVTVLYDSNCNTELDSGNSGTKYLKFHDEVENLEGWLAEAELRVASSSSVEEQLQLGKLQRIVEAVLDTYGHRNALGMKLVVLLAENLLLSKHPDAELIKNKRDDVLARFDQLQAHKYSQTTIDEHRLALQRDFPALCHLWQFSNEDVEKSLQENLLLLRTSDQPELAEIKLMRVIVSSLAKILADMNPDQMQDALLVACSWTNRPETVKDMEILLELGVSLDGRPEVPGTGGSAPLFFAVSTKSLRAAQFLLENGADVNTERFHIDDIVIEGLGIVTCLTMAVRLKHPEMVELLLRYGASLHLDKPPGRNFVLLTALQCATVEIMKLLIEAGLDCSRIDKLFYVALVSQTIVLENSLIGNPNFETESAENFRSQLAMVQFLLKFGCSDRIPQGLYDALNGGAFLTAARILEFYSESQKSLAWPAEEEKPPALVFDPLKFSSTHKLLVHAGTLKDTLERTQRLFGMRELTENYLTDLFKFCGFKDSGKVPSLSSLAADATRRSALLPPVTNWKVHRQSWFFQSL